MEETLEIRKLQTSHVQKISELLDFGDQWQVLIDNIPKQLERENFTSVDENNRPKYNADHRILIEKEAKKLDTSCTKILLDEWGTSGKIRPTIGHLRYILQKADLHVVDSYVAQQILKIPAPSRPLTGPGAKIAISELLETEDIDEIPIQNNGTNSVDIDTANPDLSLLMRNSDAGNVEAVYIDHSEQENAHMPNFSLINANTGVTDSTTTNNESSYVSSDNQTNTDYSEESSAVVESEANTSRLAERLNDSDAVPSNLLSFNDDQQVETKSDIGLPEISELLSPSSQITPKSECLNNAALSSDLSELMGQTDHTESFGIIPQLSELMSAKESTQFKRNNLSLSIELPHFSYSEIESATRQFNESPFSPENLENGRFLGSGRFSSVYVAVGLAGQPAVVKKIKLSDDMDAQQFKQDMGILSKYKHNTLVSLLGYSVDGASACLVMEFLEGGSLQDRLQDSSRKLHWKDRLKIALHTSRGIHYLHTAFKTPLVHRNIRPSNILLDSQNNSKLGDFGLTLASNSKSIYLPPEASASKYKVTVKLDIFSYGVVLLELLSLLASSDTDREDIVTHVLKTCQDGNIAPLLDTSVGSWRENDKDFAGEMFEIAQKCLADEPKKRGYIEYVNEQITRLCSLISKLSLKC